MRRTIATWLAVMMIAAAARTRIESIASAAQPSTAVVPDFDPATANQRTVQQLSASLSDSATLPAEREEAARRLLAQNDPAAKTSLLAALREQGIGAVAVARALADATRPDPDFIEPLFASFGANKTLTESAALALGNYRNNGPILQRLIDTATNRQRSIEDIRVAAIRALGSFSEKRAAEALISLVRNPNESAKVRLRAGASLAALSGIEDEMDARRWDDWWNANGRRGDDDFRAEMLQRKAGQHDRDQAQIAELADALKASLRAQYTQTPPNARDELLIAWLRSAVADVRAHAAMQIYEDFLANQPVAAGAYDELRKMIGDSSPIVRRQVVQTLGVKNDKASLEPLLAQLSQESDPDVRQQIAIALKSITDVRAAPYLGGLLRDPSPQVVRAAVQALQPIGKAVLQQRPALVEQLATTLRQIIDRTANTSQVELRADALAALVPLKRSEMVPSLFLPLLRPQEDVRVRITALQALGEIGDHNTAGAVIDCITDPDDSVVLQAVQTLGRLAPTPDQANALLPLLIGPNVRNDPTIKEEAWHVLESTLPSMSAQQLTNLAEKFRGDPGRQVAIRLQLANVLTAEKDLDNLATTKSQIARNYMDLKQFDLAVPFFRAALEYRQGNHEAGYKVDELIEGYLQSSLRSGNGAFTDAIGFAERTLRDDLGKQTTVGPLIRTRVEELAQAGAVDDLKNAAALIKLAMSMSPALSERYRSELSEAQKAIEQRLATATQGSNGPRSANSANGVATPVTTRPAAVAGDGGN